MSLGLRIGSDGLMWAAAGGTDKFSTRGSFRVDRNDEGLAVRITDLVVSHPQDADNAIVIGDGFIEGELERRCFVPKPNVDGLTRGSGEPAIDYELDPNWASEFCSRHR